MSSLLASLKSFDAYPKTLEDYRIKTFSGAAVSVVAGAFIIWLFIAELALYLSSEVHPELLVDTTRGEKLRINLDVTFHNLPCGYLSVDAMDISGDHQLDVDHNVFKQRLNSLGLPVSSAPPVKQVDIGTKKEGDDKPKSTSCYGAPNREVCETCEDVLDAYRKASWIPQPEQYEQCVREGYSQKLQEQSGEGCKVYGFLEVNKVAGNVHFAPGKSFQHQHMHVHDLQPFKNMNFNLSHHIHKFSFGLEYPGIMNPLDNLQKDAHASHGMYQYFLKVVPTEYKSFGGEVINTNQYSVTEHFKVLRGGEHGLPGVFFMYELSPIRVKYSESSKSFAHFLTGICAIIGGVFTVAGIVDSFIYTSMKSLKKKVELGKAN
eukprot:TRINITY_DN698_c0_g1_i1.p1 TRINITY_DN698_c0_g1~~TRINITY_DN698_c0_g1_i1.p1  ORF type:complete len:376 (+),score=129.04 TRINITY_DN698_c0_g1_i1:114-1241(+)